MPTSSWYCACSRGHEGGRFPGAPDPRTPIGQGWLRASHGKLGKNLTLPKTNSPAADHFCTTMRVTGRWRSTAANNDSISRRTRELVLLLATPTKAPNRGNERNADTPVVA
jgi:hypothetical protein